MSKLSTIGLHADKHNIGEIHRILFCLAGILFKKNQPTCIGQLIVEQRNKLTTGKVSEERYRERSREQDGLPYSTPACGLGIVP